MLFDISFRLALGLYAFGLIILLAGAIVLTVKAGSRDLDAIVYGAVMIGVGAAFIVMPFGPIFLFLANLLLSAFWQMVV